eukprot:5726_1
MTRTMSLLFVALISSVYGVNKYVEESCDRIRRPLHLLSSDERLIYVEGFKELRKNGKLDIITQTHSNNMKIHYGSNFFFWHSYLTWEIETQIRALGGKFKCFAMPYWDFSYDAGSEHNPSIFHSDLGSNGGGIDNNYCVSDELWKTNKDSNYWVTEKENCLNNEIYPYCCLKRDQSNTTLLATSAQIAAAILEPTFTDFSDIIYDYHFNCHAFIASNDYCAMSGAYSTDDPIFFVLHSYMTYLRSLWSSCWDYDKLDISKSINAYNAYCYAPSYYDGCGAIQLNEVMLFDPLSTVEWSLVSRKDVTIKMMYNINEWGIKYELGTFWEYSHLNEWCDNQISKEWFIESEIINKKSKVQQYIDVAWNEYQLNLNSDIANKYRDISQRSCEYNRKVSMNSCFDENVLGVDIETCADRGINDVSLLSLDDLLEFDGVKDNECLREIRKNMFHLGFRNEEMKLNLCNGKYDYKCPLVMLDKTQQTQDDVDSVIVPSFLELCRSNIINFVMVVISIILVICIVKQYCKKLNVNYSENVALYDTFLM